MDFLSQAISNDQKILSSCGDEWSIGGNLVTGVTISEVTDHLTGFRRIRGLTVSVVDQNRIKIGDIARRSGELFEVVSIEPPSNGVIDVFFERATNDAS